ncbi:acyl carrier protein [Clostridium acetobutylicum]|uniref:Acyl carrier protein n=1 Tax=Clostridium acetobutylicum (strain ATCC 824 / DSM 792 / JCM 1419 / IAM 19013 / LMG 5710 / NBRC 13948 / NRRL B-527 / VKM B-1787 / 2291 / W) TaxID=272562 RepID=Q97DA3_CLOAB|nr:MULTISPECIES: acyl carrier protein [Clostridium]AAK81500.1 Acyl Carrier Protein, ACP [Clostridium acetobutylicum ATCC 824]ADZ22621.1 Acyl Carrier Protein, ACP [Clostridium acetobutylicum EA 2018]AEI34357.1 acyl carrier protein [Clostridium acetobutylicum DSM 1731]AWV80826.1 acyl carrier protein [Clostridium acetobutylicum]MBC2393848.1 acyl carrier protein [Clostridium acetobutylicum]
MVLDKVREVIANQISVDKETIDMATSFGKDLNVDSLDLFQIIIELEEKFDIQIEDTENIKTVGDAVKFIEAQLKKK